MIVSLDRPQGPVIPKCLDQMLSKSGVSHLAEAVKPTQLWLYGEQPGCLGFQERKQIEHALFSSALNQRIEDPKRGSCIRHTGTGVLTY